MRLNTLHYVLIGTIIGMALVFGLFAFFRNKMTPTDVPEIQTAVNTAPENAEKCPVCQKPVNPASDFCMTVGPKKYNFCSDICFRSFKDDPFLYIKDDIKLNIEIIPVEQPKSTPQQPTYERIPDNPPPVKSKPATSTPKKIPEPSSGDSESNLIENIPLPDDITSQGNSSSSNEIEEIPLDSGNTNPPPAPPPAQKQDNTQNSEIEELMLDLPDTQTQQAPPPPAQQPKTQTDGNMVIEEIPLN